VAVQGLLEVRPAPVRSVLLLPEAEVTTWGELRAKIVARRAELNAETEQHRARLHVLQRKLHDTRHGVREEPRCL
jgi:hypothetical protein